MQVNEIEGAPTLMRSESDNGLDKTSFPNSWPTNSITGSASMNAAEAISTVRKERMLNGATSQLQRDHVYLQPNTKFDMKIPMLSDRPI